jgi:hypothetical protein
VTREQLAHVLRTVARVSGERDILVIGSQSILGSYPEDALPARATGSMEVDTAWMPGMPGFTAQGTGRTPRSRGAGLTLHTL